MDLQSENEWSCGFCRFDPRPCDRCILPKLLFAMLGLDDGITPEDDKIDMN